MSASEDNAPPPYRFEEAGALPYDDNGHVLVRKVGCVGEVILNRPERMNALLMGMGEAVHRAFDDLSRDENLKCVVFRGVGRAFSTGGDVAWLGNQYSSDEDAAAAKEGKKVRTSQRRRLQHDEHGHKVFEAISECNKVVIVAAQGYVLGVALDWFMAADIAICQEGTQLGYPPARMIGATGMSALHWMLRMGPTLHAEMCLLGRYIDAQEACDRGLINRVAPADRFEDTVAAATEMIASMPADGLAIGKYNRKVAFEILGVRASLLQSAMAHAMQVQQKMEPGEWNIVRERELYGVKGAYQRRDERFKEASRRFSGV